MPGGPPDAYERVRPIFEAVAARANGDPCVTWMGPGSSGHFVKMVHNGIEYAIMELIAETYDMMKRGLCYDNDKIHEVYAEWNRGELNSYLIEISADIFARKDDKTGKRLIDVILDEADQKGTGMWTTESTLAMHVPAPTIDMAVAMRDMSSYKNMRMEAGQYLCGPQGPCRTDGEDTVRHLRGALHMGLILAYSQGMALLRTASEKFGYNLDLAAIARIWRGGCIIRSGVLEDIREAYRRRPDLPDLLADGQFVQKVEHLQEDLRRIVIRAAAAGIPTPGFSASLAYFDSYRSAWLPANLIQAQRDFFGSHTYRRIDMDGVFHTHWTAVKDST
jgi:6-phosphogluconate dehydrogenase